MTVSKKRLEQFKTEQARAGDLITVAEFRKRFGRQPGSGRWLYNAEGQIIGSYVGSNEGTDLHWLNPPFKLFELKIFFITETYVKLNRGH
jgi:hypothetical protein